MLRPDATRVLDAATAVARSIPGVELLVLFGSRARGDDGPSADWDIGYLARDDADVPGLLAALVEALEDDRVDLADLGRASGLLRYRAARDGLPLFEATPDAFDRFRLDAVRFWCDVAPMLERGYGEVLGALSP